MRTRTNVLLPGVVLLLGAVAVAPAQKQGPPSQVDLPKWLAAGKLRAVNREITKVPDTPDGVHMSERQDPGVVWLTGVDFGEGEIRVEVRGRDRFQQSFLGIAFHGKDDQTYEAVYLRPFNFRAQDPVRHRHALQYMAVPEFDWPRLREQFPDEFERPVSPSLEPTGWVTLRVAVQERNVQVYVGPDQMPVLTARKLGNLNRGMVGLWTGNGSDGDFANLRITSK
ncbi:MAG TPA: hypothetical protein VMH81_29715 [Bryobacteraceae bacterium]|nr:hypothetical protein [Bryobacteraceae bacterium]